MRFWVVEAGGSAKWSKEATQKMSMTLTPVDEHGQPVYILDRVPVRRMTSAPDRAPDRRQLNGVQVWTRRG